MIQFYFKGKQPYLLQEKEDSKKRFLDYIGIYRQEFEANKVFVEVNFDYPKEDSRRFSFSSNGSTGIFSLIDMVNQWRKINPL